MTIIVTAIIIIVVVIITIVAETIAIVVMHFRWNPITGFIIIVLIVSETHFLTQKKLIFLIFLFNFLCICFTLVFLLKIVFDFYLQFSY